MDSFHGSRNWGWRTRISVWMVSAARWIPTGGFRHSVYTRLVESLPLATIVNIKDMVERIRAIKSSEEIEFLEKAAGLGDLMIETCARVARPGVRESEVYGKMREAMISNGGEDPTLFLWASDAHPLPHPFKFPTTRPLQKGDLIIFEIHPKYGGYFTHVERTFCLGTTRKRVSRLFTKDVLQPSSGNGTVHSREKDF